MTTLDDHSLSTYKSSTELWGTGRARRQSTREAFVPLHHPPCHAQVDFGEAVVEGRGRREKVAFVCLILPHSNVWFLAQHRSGQVPPRAFASADRRRPRTSIRLSCRHRARHNELGLSLSGWSRSAEQVSGCFRATDVDPMRLQGTTGIPPIKGRNPCPRLRTPITS